LRPPVACESPAFGLRRSLVFSDLSPQVLPVELDTQHRCRLDRTVLLDRWRVERL